MNRKFRWGIIGLGKIARKFAADLALVPGAQLHAVAATDLERARSFAADFGAARAFGAYLDLAQCDDLDAVYIATPHHLHHDATLMCLEKGIPVLCEKPLALNSAQVRTMVDSARRHRTFLMEALWTLFVPAFEYALERIRQGDIGQVLGVHADFGFRLPRDPASRLFNPDMGGGALLDIGIYPALLAHSVLGVPQRIQASGAFGPTGVDETCVFTLLYPHQAIATGHATVSGHTPVEARILGSSGAIYLHSRWHHPQRVTLSQYREKEVIEQTVELPYEGWGYHFEIAHVMQCIQEGLLESPRAPWQLSLDLMETLDQIGAHMRQNVL
jgi:predicted dehydrogenase